MIGRGAAPRQRPATVFHRVQVASVSELTPHMRRITFSGEDLATYPSDGPASHFKLVLPAPGQVDVTLPTQGPDGLVWPEPEPLRRTYTPRIIDRDGRHLTVDFVLHADSGPATEWAAAAQVGDRAAVTGARGAYRIEPDVAWTLLVADETALPAVGTILEEAQVGVRVMLVAEVADEAEQLTFGTAAELSTVWCYRGAARTSYGTAALQAVRDLALPVGRGSCWVGLEATAMRAIRRHLLVDRSLDPKQMHTRGYWKVGGANHPDHDTGED